MADPGDVTVALQLNTPVSNGAGGQTDSWATVQADLHGRLRNPNPRPAQYSQAGAGTQRRVVKVMVFYTSETTLPDMPAKLSRYGFLLPNGERWKVIDRNEYSGTIQFSVELVE